MAPAAGQNTWPPPGARKNNIAKIGGWNAGAANLQETMHFYIVEKKPIFQFTFLPTVWMHLTGMSRPQSGDCMRNRDMSLVVVANIKRNIYICVYVCVYNSLNI